MIIVYIGTLFLGIYLIVRLYHLYRVKRENIEDALKFLYTSHQENNIVTLETLAGRLKISKGAAIRHIEEMTNKGLVSMSGGHIKLTVSGSALGLQILRAHRLWERYLSDYTDVPLQKIHDHAEKHEHKLKEEEIKRLETQLGYPKRDPHGDIIPDKVGEFAGELGVPLTDWPSNQPARVVHIEDEPQSIFTQILNEGIIPGSNLVVKEATQTGVRLEIEDQEIWLVPIVASNIYVTPAPVREELREKILLSDLTPGQKARVVNISRDIKGFLRRRLFDLGFTKGALVEAALRSSFGKGGPSAYHIRGTLIALRREQTEKIYIDPVEDESANQ